MMIAKTIKQFVAHARKVNRGKWQGIDISKKPEMATYEVTSMLIEAPITGDIESLRDQVQPNLPWADDHFEERVSGMPLNPGQEWRRWPWGHSADKFRINPKEVGDAGDEPIFDHTYMQRYWPKYAALYPGGVLPDPVDCPSRRGIYFNYGDLGDVLLELLNDPGTRQAILPVFFPEDTGFRPGRRKPCSLSYQFQLVDDRLDIIYYIRSCDVVRHFRDDIYLTARLLLWVLDELGWLEVRPGRFIMHIGNLHCFVNDWRSISANIS